MRYRRAVGKLLILAGHSVARITRALNDAAIPCPSASDRKRNPHRSGKAWTLGTVAAILANPRYTGRQVWNRQRTDCDLIDPANTGLGHRQVQRWNLPEGWVISARPAHPALVSEADYIAAQEVSAPRGPAGTAARRYLLAGLLRCGACGRRMESSWSNGRAAYRCRHGHTSATRPGPERAKNLYVREDQILPRLAALAVLLAGQEHAQTPPRPDAADHGSCPGRGTDRPLAIDRHHAHLRPAAAGSAGRHSGRHNRHRRPHTLTLRIRQQQGGGQARSRAPASAKAEPG
jgi:Recombinase/Recombinase zinc beta ribbon domain